MSEEEAKTPKKKIRWGRIFGFIVFLGVAVAVAYGLSWLNARTYYLVIGPTEVQVGKGRMLPVGYEPFVPLDPALRRAYESFPLPGGMPLERGQEKLSDRVELDQALFRVLVEASQYSLQQKNERTPQLVKTYLARLRALPGTNAEQRQKIEDLAKEALFVEAEGSYQAGVEALEAAVDKFVASAKGQPAARAAEAQAYADRIDEALRVLRRGRAAPTRRAPPEEPPSADTPPASFRALTSTTGTSTRARR